MATMQDVANLAKASLSTVSYVINGTGPVSEATRARIIAAVSELGYRPNAIARGLASKKTRIIALIYPSAERNLGTEVEYVSGISDGAHDRGYNLIVWPAAANDPAEIEDFISQGLVDGVILMEVHLEDARVEVMRRLSLPFMIIGRNSDTTALPFADVDFEATTAEAVRNLSGLGHRRIAFINHSQQSHDLGYGPTIRATQGINAAVAGTGVSAQIYYCDESPQAGQRLIAEILDSEPEVTGLVIMNDRASFGVIHGLSKRGLEIPTDMSIISIVSSPRVADMSYPRLTTLNAPGAVLGQLGVDALIDQIEGSDQALIQELVPCTLDEHGTTGPAPTTKRDITQSRPGT